MVNEKISAGETVAAVLRNVETGVKRIVDNAGPKYKVEVIVTNLETGEKHSYEVKR